MKNRSLVSLVLTVVVVAMGMMSCGDDFESFDVYEQYEKDLVIIDTYIQENDINAYDINNTGVFIDIYHQGELDTALHPTLDEEGDVSTQYVTFSYKGYFVDGEVFVESGDSDLEAFQLSSQVSGLQIALLEMTKGDSATIIIPSGYGFGNVTYGNIPANSILIFDICLESFEKMTQSERDSAIINSYIEDNMLDAYNINNSGVYIDIYHQGDVDTSSHPSVDNVISIGYKGYLTNGTTFDETGDGQTATFDLSGLISGWQIGIPEMSLGDSATILIPSNLGYGASSVGTIPANSVLIFDVFLESYVQ